MNKSLRRSERWFNLGLWVVALLFAGSLIGIGGLVVDDLPRVDQQLRRDDVIDQTAAKPLRQAIDDAQSAEAKASDAHDQADLKLQAAQQAYANAREGFGNWLQTRKATELPDQDAELIARTKGLDDLKAAEAEAQHRVDAQNQALLDARQEQSAARQKLEAVEEAADEKLEAGARRMEMRVFLYRLALTLPLLVVAGWLFAKKRRNTWWPFVWGFILFALFAFFVELVPYLPSYGGYVHYGVGLIVTVLLGRYTIVALNRYLARQKAAEQQPDLVRRKDLDYDLALTRLAKGLCPGCERPADLKATDSDFCPHCGIGLFNRCSSCATRKSAFARYCHACGAVASPTDSGQPSAAPVAIAGA